MDLQPHPVPEPVAELLAVAAVGDRLAGHGVDLACARAGVHGLERALLRGEHERVDLGGAAVERPGGKGPRAVRAVALDDAPEVDDHQRVGRNDLVARARVRKGAVGAAGDDDREGDALGASLDHVALELERDPALGPPRQSALGECAQRLVDDRGRAGDALDLALLLDHPQILHQPARRHELHSLGNQLGQPPVRLYRQVLVVEADATRQRRGGVAEQVLLAAHPLERRRHLGLGLVEVAEVGYEGPLGPRADERDAVRAREPGQVTQVDQVRHQQRVELALGHALGEPGGAALGASRRRAAHPAASCSRSRTSTSASR